MDRRDSGETEGVGAAGAVPALLFLLGCIGFVAFGLGMTAWGLAHLAQVAHAVRAVTG